MKDRDREALLRAERLLGEALGQVMARPPEDLDEAEMKILVAMNELDYVLRPLPRFFKNKHTATLISEAARMRAEGEKWEVIKLHLNAKRKGFADDLRKTNGRYYEWYRKYLSSWRIQLMKERKVKDK